MARLRVSSGAEICALLAEHDFVGVRRSGSHVVMQRSEAETTVTVVVPQHKELRRGTLRSIIRQSGLPRRLFEAR